MRYLIICLVLVLTGCGPEPVSVERGDARRSLFIQCMELAAKMPRESDDDVADIVDACSSQSSYMTNYLRQ